MSDSVKWQPAVIVLADNARLECKCGALAIIVTGKVPNDHYNQLEDVDVWCQSCFAEAQERDK